MKKNSVQFCYPEVTLMVASAFWISDFLITLNSNFEKVSYFKSEEIEFHSSEGFLKSAHFPPPPSPGDLRTIILTVLTLVIGSITVLIRSRKSSERQWRRRSYLPMPICSGLDPPPPFDRPANRSSGGGAELGRCGSIGSVLDCNSNSRLDWGSSSQGQVSTSLAPADRGLECKGVAGSQTGWLSVSFVQERGRGATSWRRRDGRGDRRSTIGPVSAIWCTTHQHKLHIKAGSIWSALTPLLIYSPGHTTAATDRQRTVSVWSVEGRKRRTEKVADSCTVFSDLVKWSNNCWLSMNVCSR